MRDRTAVRRTSASVLVGIFDTNEVKTAWNFVVLPRNKFSKNSCLFWSERYNTVSLAKCFPGGRQKDGAKNLDPFL